jgi:hypothetical protein
VTLFFLDRIVEERIQEARRRGEFDNLSGRGESLSFDEDRHVPEDLRLAYKVLKNANCLPPELEMRREIVRLRDLMQTVDDSGERTQLIRQLNRDIMRLNLARRSSPRTDVGQVYAGGIPDPSDRDGG